MTRASLRTAWMLAVPCAVMVATPAAARDAFAKYYQAYPTEPVPIARNAGAPEVIASSGSLDRDILLMWERGYEAIGHSSFTAERQDPKDALKLAASLHARYVILCQSCAPATRDPFLLKSYSGGYAQEALFFAPLEKAGSGIMPRAVTPAERDRLGKNGAVAVIAVRNGSPASLAGLVAGDMVLSANDIRAADAETFNRLFTGDRPIRIAFVRGGVRRDVTITVPPAWQTPVPRKTRHVEGPRE
jgi:hypothetical protein